MAFIKRPRLRPGVSFLVPDDAAANEVIAHAQGHYFLLSATLHRHLVPRLSGQDDRHALVASLKDIVPAMDVLAGVVWLTQNGAIEDAADEAADLSVSVQILGAQEEALLGDALHTAGLTITPRGRAALHLIVTDDYLHPDLAAINGQQGQPWMIVRPGAEAWLGPLFNGEASACWECLAHRLRFNRRLEGFWREQAGGLPGSDPNVANPAANNGAIWAMAAQAAVHWLKTGHSPLTNGLISFAPDTLQTQRHAVVHRPQCPACGTPLGPPDKPPNLTAPPPFNVSSHGTDPASATLAAYGYHVSPITGLIDALEPRSTHAGIHVYQGGPYSGYSGRDWAKLTSAMAHRGAGKGVTAASAKTGALAETLEWYTLFAADPGRHVVASADGLKDDGPLVTPDAIAHYSAAQYAERETLNAAASDAKYKVPQPFDSSVAFPWAKMWSLRDQRWVHVPAAAICNAPCPFLKQNSNGNAAGPTIADAVVHGALEAIERDAIALWWYNHLPRPAMALDGVDAELLSAMTRAYEAAEQHFWVLDITSDLGVPVAVAIAVPNDPTDPRYHMGFGAHFDPNVAATRALTELNQLNSQLTATVAREGRSAQASASATRPPHIIADPTAPRRMPNLPLDIAAHSARDQASWLAALLADHALDMLISDLTLPDVGLPVVKVLAPGLRHAYPELGPGRLHDVPLAQGWITEPVTEAKMRLLKSPL